MKKFLSMLLALVMLIGMVPINALAVESTETGFEGKTISILGDSISTFAGVSNDVSVNATLDGGWIYYNEGTLGISRQDTWWQQTIDALGMELRVNNSWSGSCIFTTRSGTVGAYVDRCVQLHDNTGKEPDIIGIYLGTNDFCNFKSTLGTAEDINYSNLIIQNGDNYTYAAPATAAEAYAVMLHKMMQRYPHAEIYCFSLLPQINLSAANVQLLEQFNESLLEIARHFGAHTVDLYNDSGIHADENFSAYIADNSLHPGPLGMDAITELFIKELLEQGAPESSAHTYETKVTAPTCTEQGYTTYTCACGDSYVADYVDAIGEHFYENGICTGCGRMDPNPYAGKTIACIGDSITAGIGVTKDETDYVTLLAQSLEMAYIRLGASGTTLCTDGHRTCNVDKLTEQNLAGADVVTVLMGINDFCNAQEGYYTLGTVDSTDTSTIYGAVHMWCRKIEELRQRESLENTQFYFLTPVITSWNNSVSSDRNWDQSKTNLHGYTLRDLCNAIIEVCAQYDIPVIDLNLISGLYYNSADDHNIEKFGGDGVHPGEIGHQMMADAIKNALLQNHLRDDHDHSYGSWITTTYPDCDDGEQQRVCSVCTAAERKTLNGKGHAYENGTCIICGRTDSAVTALDHFEYTLDKDNSTVVLTKYIGSEANVVIPNLYAVAGVTHRPVLDSSTLFRNNTSITSVSIGAGAGFKNNSMAYLFSGCSKLASVNMTGVDTSEITDIGYLFDLCSALTSITGYEHWDTGSVENMYKAFNRTTSLKVVDLSRWDLSNVVNSGWCFQMCYAEKILLPDSLKTMSAGFLNHASKITGTSYTIPAGVEKIGYAHTIYDFATDDFVEFKIAPGNTHYAVVDGILYSADGTEMLAVPRNKPFENGVYEIPEGVTFLGELSFSRNYNITKLVLPNSFVIKNVPLNDTDYIVFEDVGNLNSGTNLSIAIYCYTGITEYAVKEDNPNYTAINGIIYSKDMSQVVAIPARYAREIVIPEGVKVWNTEALWADLAGNSNLLSLLANCTGVSIPASLTSIDEAQLDMLNSLAERDDFTVTLHEDNRVFQLDENGKLEHRQAEPMALRYDDHVDVSGKTVEIIDAGMPTSYQVGYGVEENAVPDTAVVTLKDDTLVATGIGTAKVCIDGQLYEVEVTAAPISLLLLVGQSNMEGNEGDLNQSIVCPDGMVYATYGDRYDMNIDNATHYAPSALTGQYREINTVGGTDGLCDYPVYMLTDEGAGRKGPDSGFAYEWVQQTGEKVWIVNASHGGTSLNVWQPGTTQYEECQAMFGACTETLRKEIAAGHFTLSHMAYFWCQGCNDRTQTAQWYVDKYLAMHESFKTELAFDHDSDSTTADKTFEFGGIIPVRAGNAAACYRDGINSDVNAYAYHESFSDLRMSGPRVAQYWMGNNPELADIWNVCTIGEDWVWMPDGTNGVAAYFQTHYENGTVDYTTQVPQSESWYTPTTPAAVHDSIHYNQIGYNEVGRESVRNALVYMGINEDYAEETTVTFVNWTGYQEVEEISAATTAHSGTLVVPIVSPVTRCKDVTYSLSQGLSWEYYDLIAESAEMTGTLTATGAQGSVNVVKAEPGKYFEDHLSQLPGKQCCGVNLWSALEHDSQYYTVSGWGTHSSGEVYSVTIPVIPGDRIFATSYGKAGQNGHVSSNGIRTTFLGEYGVVKTMTPAETYSEFSKNGYLTAPEGTVAINVPMWTNDDSNELYILNLPHDTDEGICGICGKDTHVHSWSQWQTVSLPTEDALGVQERSCACGETETREVEGVWQTHELGKYLLTLPERYCAGTNLWTLLPHTQTYYYSGIHWGTNASADVWSVTIPVEPGDRIFATSFGKAGENGYTSNGIRATFFDAYGVCKTMSPAETYAEFTSNGGYLVAPEGALAINVPMYGNSNEHELYILSAEHDYESAVTPPTCTEQGYTTHTCTVCGDSKLETQTMDITDLFAWTDGKMILATTGACTDFTTWQASDYVDISVFDSLVIKTANTISVNTTTGLAFYDADKNYISGVRHTDGVGEAYGTLLHTLEIPENAVYVRSTWYGASHPNYDSAFGEFSCTATGQYVPPTGHSYELVSTTPPICTAQGTSVYTCSDCGDSYTEYVNRAEHTYDDGVCTVCSVSILGGDWLIPEFAEGDYTMVVVPDTQILVQSWPEIYYNQMQWIADNKDTLNIQAVMHMGDMVNNNNDTEWTVCETGTDLIEAAGIPWMPMRGNHDDSVWFNRYYDYSTYGTNQSWFGGSYEEGKLDHTYWFVTIGEREYMILSLGWAPSWDVLDWAQDIVEANADKNVILNCHAYMNSDGSLLAKGDALDASNFVSGCPSGEDVWAAFKDYENVVLAMGGHVHSQDVITYVDQNGAGQNVTSMLFDRQNDDTVNRYAMVGLLTFHANSNTVDVNWYSTRYDALFRAKNQFSIGVPHLCEHAYETVVTAPTCTEQGYTTHTCACGDSYVDSYVDANGHTEETVPGEAASCGKEGKTEGSRCPVCSTVMKAQETIPATGNHTYSGDRDEDCDVCGFEREVEPEIKTTPMYRLYNPNSGEHFYTGSVEERDMLIDAGWIYEGIAWNAPTDAGAPVYRLYNPNSGDHHYTMSVDERDMLVGVGWKYEGVAWNSATADNLPQYRLYNPNADCGSHHYTGSTEERDFLISAGWIYEGIGWFGMRK